MNSLAENEITRLGDVAVAIEMVDNSLEEKDAEKTTRALTILTEIFNDRYASLRLAFYGGVGNG